MKQIIELEDLKNKTIKDIKMLDGCSKLGIVFEGEEDSFCIFKSYWDGTFENIELSEFDGDLCDMYDLGFISEEQWNKILEDEQKECEKQAKENRYNEYLKLKKEFEND